MWYYVLNPLGEEFLDNRSSLPVIILGGIVAAAFLLMLWASSGDSAIMDELAHIPAGYSYLNNLDYRLNPEHPPLVKVLAAFPLTFLDLYFPTDNDAWRKDVNGQWAVGADFLYGSGNDADYIVRSARILPMVLTLFLIILVYVWAAEILGRWWALLPALFFGLSPTVLAHGHYVTTDIGATFGVVLATYLFVKFLLSPSVFRLIVAGIGFGVGELTKFSTVLLVPYFLILIILFFIWTVVRDWNKTENDSRIKRFSVRAWRYLRSTIAIFAIGYIAIVYPVYALFTLNYPAQKQTTDTEFILTSFASGPTPAGQLCKPVRCLADVDIWMTKNPITKPFAEYLLGVLMVLQRSSGGNTAYFLGEVSAAGSPLYFPTVYLLKEPLPSLIVVLLAGIFAIFAFIKNVAGGIKKSLKSLFDFIGRNFAGFSMFVFVIFYWVYSVKSPLNIGVRHLLPTFPFVYIISVAAIKKLLANGENGIGGAREKLERFLKPGIIFVIVFWFALEAAFSAPYFLSYFNEIGGGVYGGYKYVTDSNYDWGQDLIRLKEFVENYKEIDPVRSSRASGPEGTPRLRSGSATSNGIDKIAVDYFGGGNPKYSLGEKEIDWSSSKGNPAEKGIYWLAVSVNTLQSAIQPLAPGQRRNPEDEYRWLTSLRPPKKGMGELPGPNFIVGTSIFVYKL